MVSAFSAGCPADRTEGGDFRQGSLSMCERLPLPPLVFPLIFNKQELRLSATGPQFVPTTEKTQTWQRLLEEPVQFQRSVHSAFVCSLSLRRCDLDQNR